jgi:hypothetical protein
MTTLSIEDNLGEIESRIRRCRRYLAEGKREEAFGEVMGMSTNVSNMEDHFHEE